MNNSKLKITAIVRFDHSVVAVGQNFGRREVISLDALRKYAECRGYEINVTHAHPAGLPSEALAQDGGKTKGGEDGGTAVPVLRTVCAGMKS